MDNIPREEITFVLAVDPGRDKCGVAIVTKKEEILFRRVVPVAQMGEVVADLAAAHSLRHIVLGNSTMSRHWQDKLREWLPQAMIYLQEESGSTLAARPLYWKVHPPRGWRRLVPLSLQEPPEPIDDFAAVILARRFFGE